MSYINDLLAKLKAWAIEEKAKLSEVLSPVLHEVGDLVAHHLSIVAANVGAVVIEGIQNKKSVDDIKNDAVNSAKLQFKTEGHDLLDEAATKVGLAVAQAHFDIHPDYSHLNK